MATGEAAGSDIGRPDTLAIHGGVRLRTAPFPSVDRADGRTIGAEEREAVLRVLDSGTLCSVVGTETRAFEQEFAALYGVPYATCTTSGTASIHLAVGAVDPAPGDEIIVPPLTDFGTIIPVLRQNAIPVFADVDPVTGILDPASVRSLITERTRAIIVVHLFGNPAPMEEFVAIAREHDLKLIEDCAQAFLTEPGQDGRYAGTYGDIGCFSFQQSKHITTGDGGVVITSDEALGRRMRLFVDKAWPRETGERTNLFLGANYRMTELQAAVGRAQLPKLKDVVARRREGGQRLAAKLEPLAGIRSTSPAGGTFWQFPVLIDPKASGGTNAEWAAALTAEGIPVAAGYLPRPLYDTPVLQDGQTYGGTGFPYEGVRKYGPGLCPEAERLIGETMLVVAWNENYTRNDVDDIAAAFWKVGSAFTGGSGTGQP
jgi:dTDP-4-amino-4,6-dideoxygalactose transaminase